LFFYSLFPRYTHLPALHSFPTRRSSDLTRSCPQLPSIEGNLGGYREWGRAGECWRQYPLLLPLSDPSLTPATPDSWNADEADGCREFPRIRPPTTNRDVTRFED